MKQTAIKLLTIFTIASTTSPFQPRPSRFQGNSRDINVSRRERTKVEASGFWDSLSFAPKYKRQGKKEIVRTTKELEQILVEVKAKIDEANLVLQDAESVLSQQLDDSVDDRVQPEDNENDWSSMTVPMLKQALKERDLAVTGKKVDLVARLAAFESETLDDASDDTEDGLLVAEEVADPEEIMAMEIDEIGPSMDDSTRMVDKQPDMDHSSMTVTRLQKELRSLDLSVSGKKVDLIARLESHHVVTASAQPEPEVVVAAANDVSGVIELPSVGHIDYSSMTVAQLKEQLRTLELAVGGTKADLIARLDSYPPNTTSAEEESKLAAATTNDDKDIISPVEVDYTGHTVTQLKMLLRKKGLEVGGKKADLIERLQNA